VPAGAAGEAMKLKEKANMNRFKCPRCGGNQYTAADEAEKCIYCEHQELEKMDTLEEKSLDGRTWDEMPK